MKERIFILSLILIGAFPSIVIISHSLITLQQIECREQKTFINYLGTNAIMDVMKYEDQRNLFGTSSLPTLTIACWDRVSITDKIAIRTTLLAQGWTESP